MPGNWNNDDPNNPLRALLNGRNLYGRAGSQVYDADPSGGASWMREAAGRMPQYYSQTTAPGSEGGGGDTLYQLSDLARSHLRRNGETWTQLPDMDVGTGANNVKDPSLVQWDDEMGLITPSSNIAADRNAEGGDLATFVIPALAMGGITAMHAMGAGAAGSGGLEGMYGGGEGASSLPDSYWGMTADSGGIGSDAIVDGAAGYPENMAEWATGSQAGGEGLLGNGGAGAYHPYDSFMDKLNYAMANPGSTASGAMTSAMKDPQTLMRLAGLVTSLGGSLSDQGGGGDAGPSELGSMGWKPPQSGAYRSATYDPRYGSPYSGWQDQYAASLKPILGGMYGGR